MLTAVTEGEISKTVWLQFSPFSLPRPEVLGLCLSCAFILFYIIYLFYFYSDSTSKRRFSQRRYITSFATFHWTCNESLVTERSSTTSIPREPNCTVHINIYPGFINHQLEGQVYRNTGCTSSCPHHDCYENVWFIGHQKRQSKIPHKPWIIP